MRGERAEPGLAWTHDFIYRGELLLAEARPPDSPGQPETLWHYHLDHLGTPRLITDSNGVEVSRHNFYPFGREINGKTADFMLFTGHERDDVDGQYYMHARYDNAILGRFLSVDPVMNQRLALVNPQAWNRYIYVLNNPMRFTDALGLDTAIECNRDSDGKVRCTFSITVKRPSVFVPVFNSTQPYFNYLKQWWAMKSQADKPNQSSFTKDQCKAIGIVAEREQQVGTGRAAAASSNTWGDRTIGAFNVDFNTRGNAITRSGAPLDVDWYTDVMSTGDSMRPVAPLTYSFGKSFWHAAGGTQGYPFVSDPGEPTAVYYAMSGTTYLDIYKDNCQ